MQTVAKREKKKTSESDRQTVVEKASSQHTDDIYQVTSAHLFRSLDEDGDGYIIKKEVTDALESRGILSSDPRIQETISKLEQFKDTERISQVSFHDVIFQNITLVEKALKGDLVIPDFSSFKEEISTIFEQVRPIKDGNVADYIPQLARVDSANYAISICMVDGQQLKLGDFDTPYCVQSTCKPINYCQQRYTQCWGM